MKNVKTKPLSEQVIVITGSSSGIGLATARLAAKEGARVVLSSRNASEIDRLAAEIREAGGHALGVAADVRSLADLEHLRDEAVRAFGGIDTWINNAGNSIFGPTLEVPFEEEKELFETNFWGVRHGVRVAVPELAKRGGVLINIGSELSGATVPLQGMYTASKHAVKAYTDAVRMELEKEGKPVAVCLVRPAGIDTPFADHATNRLKEGEPSLPAPVYDPEVVARAICRAAEHPQRDVYVGGASRAFTVFETLFPRLYDQVVEALMFKGQSAGGTHPHDISKEALWTSPAEQGEVRGNHAGHVARTSAYTGASQHPLRTLAIFGALAAAGGIAWAFEHDRKRAAKATEVDAAAPQQPAA
jgi:short-subunit dehydrogenase